MADDEEKPFKLQFLETMSALIISAFGLVAALAWNETIKTAVAKVFDEDGELLGLFVYALLVTILAVAATMLITRATNKAKRQLKAKKKSEE
ncbi:hypothetical protein TALC_01297 [Thermoplasmatales archaeon BRNA1]|nr:hypothetical protein TALC_01297 [Thermoplasmatales archaeon BRNA1]